MSASTSLISFRLDELTKNLTAGRGRSFWFILEPLIISKATFEALTPEQQRAVQEIGQELEAFSFAAAKADDEEITQDLRRPRCQDPRTHGRSHSDMA